MNDSMEPLEQLREDLKDHISKDEEMAAALKKTLESINRKLDPIVDVYKAVIFSKSFITGLAAIVVGVGAIGAGFIWIINSVIHK